MAVGRDAPGGSAIVVIVPRPELPPVAAPPGRPAVTLSYAQTLDGRLATPDGNSQWIGGPASLRFAHELRAAHDAILVGVGTVLRDDPRLTVRLAPGRDPLRVVADSALRTPPAAAVLAGGAAAGTLLAVTARAPAARRDAAAALGATVLELPAGADGRVDLGALLAALYARGVRGVMVEGGAALIAALLGARLVDCLAVAIAPKLLGAGLAAVGDLGIRDLDRALVLRDARAAACGADLLLTARVEYPEGPDGA
ncbi:MAG TPA: dihydrofolate reductase family protein [Thermomicrobiales bacterium]|nr:dihydrofolate reductase family protein [Thermomicrobiales bacterium]